MKSRLTLITMGVLATFAISSCLQNEEPDGLKNMRDSQAELYKANAAHKTAEIALVKAESEFQKAVAERERVENQLEQTKIQIKEVEVKAKQLDLELKEKKIELDIKKDELDLALKEASSEAEIEEIKAKQSALELIYNNIELQKLENENEKLRLENEMQNTLVGYEIAIKEAKYALAMAEQEYQETMSDIAKENVILNLEIMEQMEWCCKKIENVRSGIRWCNEELADLNVDLLKAQHRFHYKEELIYMEAEKADKEFDIEKEKASRELFANLDLNAGEEELLAKAEELEQEIEVAQKQIAEMQEEENQLEEQTMALDNRQEEINLEIEETKNQYNKWKAEMINDARNKPILETREFKFDVTPSMLNLIGVKIYDYNNQIRVWHYDEADPEKLLYNIGIEQAKRDPISGEFSILNNQLKATGTLVGVVTGSDLLDLIIPSYIYDYLLTPAELEKLRAEYDEAAIKVSTLKVEYDKLYKTWKDNVIALQKTRKEYGLVSNQHTPKDLLAQAVEAKDELIKVWADAEMKEEEKVRKSQPLCSIIFKEQELRHELADMAVIDWEKLDPKAKTWATDILESTKVDEYVNAVAASESEDLGNYNYDNRTADFKSLNEIELDTSLELFNEVFEKDITEQLSSKLTWVVNPNENPKEFKSNQVNIFSDEDNQRLNEFNSMGLNAQVGKIMGTYSDNIVSFLSFTNFLGNVVFFDQSKWYVYHSAVAQLERVKSLLDSQAGFEKMESEWTVIVDEIESIGKMDAVVKEIQNKQKETQLAIGALEKEKHDIDVEYDALNQRIQTLEFRSMVLSEMLEDKLQFELNVIFKILHSESININGEFYLPGDPALEKAWKKELKNMDEKIAEKEQNYAEFMKDYEAYKNNEEKAQEIRIAEINREIEFVEAVKADFTREYEAFKKQFETLQAAITPIEQ